VTFVIGSVQRGISYQLIARLISNPGEIELVVAEEGGNESQHSRQADTHTKHVREKLLTDEERGRKTSW